MHVAGNQDAEYGDNSCIMGNAKNWRGINAPHRMILNWIDFKHYNEMSGMCSESSIITLTSLHVAPPIITPVLQPSADGSAASGQHQEEQLSLVHTSVIMFPKHGGGSYYVSFRASKG